MSEPAPRMAGDNEGPVGGGIWYRHCSSCCRLTTHASFMDEHGCDVGGGCTECRYLWTQRACEFARATVITMEQFKASLTDAKHRRAQ